MSDQEGNGGRATLAVVLAELRGLRDFSDAKFSDLQRQMDSVTGLPIIVNGLLERVKQHDEELEEIRRAEIRRREWRVGPLVANLIGFATVCIAIVALVVSSHGG